MATLVELASNIVISQASANSMTMDNLILTIEQVYFTLKKLEEGTDATPVEKEEPALTIKQAFKKDQVTCMICGKGGFKTLTRHINQVHGLKPGQYRKQFNIPSSQSLTAKNYSEIRREAANQNNLAANLEKARAARKKKVTAAAAPVQSTKAAVKTKPGPKVKTKSKAKAGATA